MKNSNYFPFERNKYFYGKLLSVDDFELEQKYVNNKRRMINRFLYGAGVVAGLYVVGVDEQTISLEKGFALDSWGREIVVDVPIIKKISLIDGFESCIPEEVGYVYLCLEYDEKETDKVHNIAGNVSLSGENSNLAYNKIKEGYHISLTSREPEGNNLSASDWYLEKSIIYQADDIKITQIVPRYVQAGKEVELKIQIENTGRKTVAFSYDLVLNSLFADGKARIQISFDEMLFERTGTYEISYTLHATDTYGVEATTVIAPDTVRMTYSGVAQKVNLENTMTISVIQFDEKEAVLQEYYKTSMEKILRDGYQQPVYLAKIFMVKAADSYIIEKIENVPFKQYVSNNVLQSAMSEMLRNEISEFKGLETGKNSSENGTRGDKRGDILTKRGVATVYLQSGGQRGDRFFSGEIIHGLGLGKVTLILGLERQDETVIYGSSEIFEPQKKNDVEAEIAACQNPNNGSFVIGIRLLSATTEPNVTIHWTAIRDMEDAVEEKNEKRIFIKPNLLELRVRESYCLEAVCENMIEKVVQWSVKDEGGSVDENGMYTAPNTAGVYEVVAQSVAFPEVKASIFVIVRELE